MADWIDIKEYNPEIHGTSLLVILNRDFPYSITHVVYIADGNSSKWWTSFPDGGLRTCGEPHLFWN